RVGQPRHERLPTAVDRGRVARHGERGAAPDPHDALALDDHARAGRRVGARAVEERAVAERDRAHGGRCTTSGAPATETAEEDALAWSVPSGFVTSPGG